MLSLEAQTFRGRYWSFLKLGMQSHNADVITPQSISIEWQWWGKLHR
jgi:hypothetical protein